MKTHPQSFATAIAACAIMALATPVSAASMSASRSWSQTGLTLGHIYPFRVKVRNSLGEETLWSLALDVSTIPVIDNPTKFIS